MPSIVTATVPSCADASAPDDGQQTETATAEGAKTRWITDISIRDIGEMVGAIPRPGWGRSLYTITMATTIFTIYEAWGKACSRRFRHGMKPKWMSPSGQAVGICSQRKRKGVDASIVSGCFGFTGTFFDPDYGNLVPAYCWRCDGE